MSNSLNKIHYAVEIELLNLGQDNPGIGMEGGTIRYISDGIDASTCTYKDTGLAVTETYYSDIVDEDGFGDMGSSINIEASGDFAYLQEFELALANIVPATGNTYAQELDAEETYALGGIVTGYVIKDNVFVQRYSGVTVDTVINTETETFTWVCEDASLNDNTIINNKAYGKIKQTIIVDVESVSDATAVYSSEIMRIKPDKGLDTMYPRPAGESKVGPQMSDGEIEIGATGYAYQTIEPGYYVLSGRTYECSSLQLESDYFQIWIYTNPNIDMDRIVYAGIDIGGDPSKEKYTVEKWDTYVDMFGEDITRILVKGKCPLAAQANQYDENGYFVPYTKNEMELFEGTVLRLYDVGTKIIDGFNVDNISKLADVAGNEISKDVITKVGDNYYLPYNVITYKREVIPDSDIKIKYTDSESFDGLQADVGFSSYNGGIFPNANNKVSHLQFTNNCGLNRENYEKIYLGVNAYKRERIRTYSGRVGQAYTQFVFDSFPDAFKPNYDRLNFGYQYEHGNLTGTAVNNLEADFRRTFANGLNITIGDTVFNSYKFGLILEEKQPTEMYIPYGQRCDLDWNGDDSFIDVYNYGGTNLPYALDYSPQAPKIRAADSLGVFYNDKTGLPSAAWGNQREIDMFFADVEISDETATTAADMTSSLNSSKFFVNISTEYLLPTKIWTRYNDGSKFESVRTVTDQSIIDVPASINFSYIGTNNNSSDEIYATYNDNITGDNGTDTIGKILYDLTGADNVKDIRPTYYAGRFIDKQTNTMSIVTELCKNSFIAGYRDRKGDLQFKRMLEFDNVNAIVHDEDLILSENGLSFEKTPIDKVFNEPSIKYCYDSSGIPQKTLEINNVNMEEFPVDSNIVGNDLYSGNNNPSSYTFSNVTTCTHSVLYFLESVYTDKGYDFQVGDTMTLGMLPTDPSLNNGLSGEFVGVITSVNTGYDPSIGDDAVQINLDALGATTLIIDNPNTGGGSITPSYNSTYTSTSFESENTYQEWKEWVVGIDDYSTAKATWLLFREGKLRTGVINKSPSNMTDLKYATELNYFYDDTVYNEDAEWAKDYLNNFLKWSIFQKVYVSYSLPITDETIEIELMDNIKFSEGSLTSDNYMGGYGKGWVTAYNLSPVRNEIDITIMLEPNNLNPEANIESNGFYPFTMDNANYSGCDIIIEDSNNTDIIEEKSNNTIIIEERKCPQ